MTPAGRLRVGCDLVALPDIEHSVTTFGDRFLAKIYTAAEIAYCAGRTPQLAARFAAKEATIKALAGAPGVSWHHMEIGGRLRTPPQLLLHGPAKELADELGVSRAHLSITHDGGVAAAVVVLERD